MHLRLRRNRMWSPANAGRQGLKLPSMRRRVLWLFAMLLAAVPFPAPASSHPNSTIVPSRGIGPYQLGMTPAQVQALRKTAPCTVEALYTSGKASRLETNCGGAYRTPEHVQVGEGPMRMLMAYGTPQRRTASDFAGARGEWLHFTREGIAFRIVYADSITSGLIQAIAVFRGTAPSLRRQIPPFSPVPPEQPPGLGE